ncbi:structural maintenance of chromosomes 5 [Brevipalpus obovatus]|uniref:structural maintenance of chromosomes 5 n=1 Tax=Brevipalpus obovatus TaxID=246614 RepID=UPI003D9DFA99
MPPVKRRAQNGSYRGAYRDIDVSCNQSALESPFARGSIVRVRLENFMTYKTLEIRAGPYLNMVLGPNGTGKSALVCAMIIGLAGDASTTGRAGSFYEYIRFGCESAIVQIELYNPGQNYVIERKIAKDIRDSRKCHTKWKLNGADASQVQVRDLISSLNIRVDNLCQFLPQERVVEFCKMDPKELLENTEKAAGDEDMFSDHAKLKEISSRVKEISGTIQRLGGQLRDQQNVNERLQEQVGLVRERKQYEEKLAWLEKKKPWIEYERYRLKFEDAKRTLDEREKELVKRKAKNAPLERKIQDAQQKFDSADRIFKNSREEVTSALRDIQKLKHDIESIGEQINDAVQRFESEKHSEQERIQAIKAIEQEIALLEEKLLNCVQVDVTEDLNRVETKLREENEKNNDYENEKSTTFSKRERLRDNMRSVREDINRINAVTAKRMELLQRAKPFVHKAAMWLEENKGQFRAKIYPPIMTQINVKKQEWIPYVEHAIPNRDLFAFVCEDLEDYKKFSTAMNSLDFRVSIVQAPSSGNFEPSVPLDHISQYGFTHFLTELFTAPPAIMRYLCRSFNLHNIPIASADFKRQQFLASGLRFGRFFGGNYVYGVSISKYDKELVTTSDKVKDPRLLIYRLDQEARELAERKGRQIQEEIETLEQEIARIDEEISSLHESIGALRAERQELLMKRGEKQSLESRIRLKKESLIRKQKEEKDIAAIQKRTGLAICSYEKKRSMINDSYISTLEKLLDLNRARNSSWFEAKVAQKYLERSKRKLKAADASFSHLENEIKRLKEVKDIKRQEARRFHAIAQKAIGTDGVEIPPSVRNRFKNLPNTIDEIDAEMTRLALRLDNMEKGDENVLREYDEATAAINQKRKEVDSLTAELRVKQTSLEMIKNRWLPPLNALISKINDNFGRFMSRLDCAGEVSLSIENEEDFTSYGICIKVKYRDNEELKELTATHQSGGERSVATMVYMIALQELTKVPFRIVDEINQGMDDKNERKVFDLIVETASSNSSQYFLYSPKLLPGLTYSEKMDIHLILNGPKTGPSLANRNPSEKVTNRSL